MGLSNPCLLLDLDCATIYGGNPRDGLRGDVVLLHPQIAAVLNKAPFDVILLTHRSAAQAATLRRALEARGCQFRDCISARELFYSALRAGRWRCLVGKGLSKAFALDYLKRRYGLSPEATVLLDDRQENLDEMLSAGCRRAVRAPFAAPADMSRPDAHYTSYALQDVVDWLTETNDSGDTGCFTAPAQARPLSDCPVIAQITEQEASLLEAARARVNRWRKALRRQRRAGR
ncbi:hypothetical protein Q4485_11645 [Granulosicoccaceae sp. 1_MG-2023]|nr:hypothetical protein [Granulosicoccaceae sp. 1_MG-2023]